LALVDITPGVTPERAGPLVESVAQAASMRTEEDLLGFLSAAMPRRSIASIRRSIGHSIVRSEEGWRWRYDTGIMDHASIYDASPIWELLGRICCPVMLIRGEHSRAVEEADVAEFRRRLPSAEVTIVEGAGHSVQSDKPHELAALLERSWASTFTNQ
jgi:pimeloyl-ACP methyl ester carboxylesterase